MMIQTYFIIAIAVGGALIAFLRTRDTFHPMVVLGPMLAFLYGYMPIDLDLSDGFRGYLTMDLVSFAQWVNLGGVAAIAFGVFLGARELGPLPAYVPSDEAMERLRKGALLLGFVGVIGYAVNIINVGGFTKAYGVAYGGGWSDSGYVRDSMLLTLPALMLLGLIRGQRRNWAFWSLLTLFSLPLAIQGLFGARRGPTFMAASGAGVGYYLGRQKRPGLLTLAAAGVALALLLLFLVSNRGNIYVGSEEKLDRDVGEYLKPGTGNEFIYGSGMLVHYDMTERFTWGARYFAILFIRPIPRALWPTKYVFVSQLFGLPNLELNLGTEADSFEDTLGWKGAIGAAPGLVADMFVEFGWGYGVALFALGFLFGKAWRKATGGGVWVIVYSLLLSLSLYLVMQTVEAMAFRFLFTLIPTLLVWRWAHAPRPQAAPMSRQGAPAV